VIFDADAVDEDEAALTALVIMAENTPVNSADVSDITIIKLVPLADMAELSQELFPPTLVDMESEPVIKQEPAAVVSEQKSHDQTREMKQEYNLADLNVQSKEISIIEALHRKIPSAQRAVGIALRRTDTASVVNPKPKNTNKKARITLDL